MIDTGIRCCVLASGSTGNAIYIQGGSTRLLIDIGVGVRQLQAGLAQIGTDGRDLDAVLLTHEHTDHIKGVPSVLRKWGLPIYASEGTLRHVAAVHKQNDDMGARRIRADMPFSLGEFVVEPFTLSHDADEPLGFCFYRDGEKLVLMTDCGYVSERVRSVTRGAHAYILETNHDIDMLRTGSYPWHLKRRILGDKGHLSNAYAAQYLTEAATADTRTVYLAHLSHENNRPDLALQTVREAVCTLPHEIRNQLSLVMTSPTLPTTLEPIRPLREAAEA